MNTKKLNVLSAALVIFMLSVPSAHAGSQRNPNPGIVPPQAVFKGKTAGEWTAAWWQWVAGTDGWLQLFDETGEYAHVNNNGADGVFFLAKSWADVPQERHVEIPSGTPLYIPVMGLGQFGRYPGRLVEVTGSVEAAYETFILPGIQDTRDLSVVIDGVPVAGLEDGNLHYMNFTEVGGDPVVPITTNNYLPSFGPAMELIGFEISLILTPLPPGKHVIQMKGKGSYDFATDVTYHLTVR